jgi:hypothetical protein
MVDQVNQSEQVGRIKLRLTGSESLRSIAGELIDPRARRVFAQRAFHLYLRTEDPIELPLHPITGGRFNEAAELTIANYSRQVEDIKAKNQIYTRHLHLTPELRTYPRIPAHIGAVVLFELSLTPAEKERLLAPPFDEVADGRLFVGHHFPEVQLIPVADRAEAYERMRSRLHDRSTFYQGAKRAEDAVYVNRPAIEPPHFRL